MAVQSSPTLTHDGAVLFVGSWDHTVYALRTLDGSLLWNFTTASIVESSPTVSDDGAALFVGSNDRRVYKLSAADGSPLWNYSTGSLVTSSPTLGNGLCFVGSWDGHVYALEA